MTSSLPVLALLAPAALLVVAALAVVEPGRRPDRVARCAVPAAWAGVVVAALGGVVLATHGSVQSPLLGVAGLGVSVRLDPLSVVMLGMIATLVAVVLRYSRTYLDGDARHGRFIGLLALTGAAVEVLVLSGNLALLVAAWIATSLALHRLLVFYPDRPGAVVAARKKFVAARLGDALLVAAVVLLYREAGTGDLQAIFDQAAAAAASGVGIAAFAAAAVYLAVAAALKSAQFPTHGWLVEVMETPTPVSALLHAGILNAGPFLVIRMSPVVDASVGATAMLVAVGAATALFASIVLLTQPTIKVALGYSSVAHMGFMLFVCGLGLYPAAFLHLVAHSFYKAHAFLASGSVVDEAKASGVALPRRLGSPARLASSALVAVALYLGVAALWGVDLVRDPVLLAVGAILVLGLAQIVAPTLDSAGPLAGTLRATGLALAVTVSFFTLEAGAHALLAGTVPDALNRGPLHLALVAIVLVSFTAVVVLQIVEPVRTSSARRRRLAVHLRNGLYANAAFDRLVGALRLSAR